MPRRRSLAHFGGSFQYACKSFPKPVWTWLKQLEKDLEVHNRIVLMAGVLLARDLAMSGQTDAIRQRVQEALALDEKPSGT